MRLVPATPAFLAEYYGAPVPVTMRGIVLLDDNDTPLGVAGFMYKTHSVRVIFSEMKPEVLQNHKIWIMKAAKMLMRVADDNGWTLVADRDQDIQSSEKFLEHLGFEQNAIGEYVRWPFRGVQ